jgi:ADP-ribosylglycohydrolase
MNSDSIQVIRCRAMYAGGGKGICRAQGGGTVSSALSRFEVTGESFSGSTDPHSAGNGSIMRLAPMPLSFASNPEQAIAVSAASSRTTHGTETAVDAWVH